MEKLAKLTQEVRRWNMMGHSLLPELELIIVHSSSQTHHTDMLIQQFQATELPVALGDEELQSYRFFLLKDSVIGRVHLMLGFDEPEIKDHEFRKRKKLIQKFIKKKQSIFLVFSTEDERMILKSQEYLSEFGYALNANRIIASQLKNPNEIFPSQNAALQNQILQAYERIFKFDLVANYRMMRVVKKEVSTSSKRFLKWKKVLEKEEDAKTFSLMTFKCYTETMVSSFTGTYLAAQTFESLGFTKSIHWKVMELLHGIWEVEGDLLRKTVDSFPLSYIEQQYKMNDYYSIGGFLPDACFKSIFSPPLYKLRDSLLSSVENVKQNILHHVEEALAFIFQNTNIKNDMIEKELGDIEKICLGFQDQLLLSLNSQIQFIHANPEDFWNYRQLNSSFYTPQQQVYIEIKYIGKAYVQKVFDSLKDSFPRFIGQGLLKKIVAHFLNFSFKNFIETVRDKPLQIEISALQREKYEADLSKAKELSNLINFFSLKVSSSYLIKDLNEKKQREYDRLFGKCHEESDNAKVQKRDLKEFENSKGMIDWVKQLFRRKERKQKAEQVNARSMSSEKKRSLFHSSMNIEESDRNKPSDLINEKQWLLIINTGKEVSDVKIKFCARDGFPRKFRSSIWMYLSTRESSYQKIKLSKLLETETPQEETVRQIHKDVHRTSPRDVFQYKLKESLTRVLIGYSICDPELQYTQGMNFITAVILLTLTNHGQKASHYDQKVNLGEVEEKAFTILRYIMQQKGVRKLLFISAEIMSDLEIRLNDLIQELSPKMMRLIEESPFGCQMLFSSPLLSCLTNVTTNLSLLQRFMDMLISHDFLIVYRIIGYFVANCEFMIGRLTMENMFDFFRNRMYDEVLSVVGEEGVSKIFHSM